MKKFNWKDDSSYSKGERGNIPPSILRTSINGVTIIIHRHRDYAKTWLLSCSNLNIDNFNLRTDDFDIAEEKAKEKLLSVIAELNLIKDYILESN